MKINGMEFTVGADPEVFVKLNNEFVSAHGLVPGTKEQPHPVENGAVQVDGMALEFNIDPAFNFEEFNRNITSVMDSLEGMIKGYGYEFLDTASVIFDEKFLEGVPEENKVLGCEPDYNAWSGSANESPDPTQLMRTVGGHVHIGWTDVEDEMEPGHLEHCVMLAKALDDTIGTQSLHWDHDDKRRSMYGKAGSFRPKKYGMEYRSLSNKWIFHEETRRFVYDGVRKAIEKVFDPNYKPHPRIQRIIDGSLRDRVENMGVLNVAG